MRDTPAADPLDAGPIEGTTTRIPPGGDLMRTSICDRFSISIKMTTHRDHISHCKTASGTLSIIVK